MLYISIETYVSVAYDLAYVAYAFDFVQMKKSSDFSRIGLIFHLRSAIIIPDIKIDDEEEEARCIFHVTPKRQ